MLPIIIYSAISLSIYTGLFIPMLTRSMKNITTIKNPSENALFAMIFLGLGSITGGALSGQIRDRFGNRIAFLSQIFLTVVSITMLIVYNTRNHFDILAYLMCFIWGLNDAGTQCLIRCMLGFEFKSKTTPFGVFSMICSASSFVFLIISSHIYNPKLSIDEQI